MNTIHVSGKRKRAIARATLTPGSGIVTINNIHLDGIQPPIARLKMQEPLILAGDIANKVTIHVRVKGGGVISQATAVRLAIARAFVAFDAKLKEIFLEYDRTLLVADVRRNEPAKPNSHGKARAKVQKSYR
jgi:small subunit ribosomal protein S9